MIDISSWTGLDDIRNGLSDDYQLTRSLLTTDGDYAGIGDDWSPIFAFAGSLDGKGFIIDGLTIVGSTGYGWALIAETDAGASVALSNLGLTNVDISGNNSAAALVGNMWDGTITNCYATGSVSGADQVGGLIGAVAGSSVVVSDCYANVNVTNAEGGTGLGGFVGEADGGEIKNCYSVGTVSNPFENSYVGGFAGINYGTVTNCGWWSASGPTNAIAEPVSSITYAEADKTAFYDKTHNVYDGAVPYWDFVTPIWVENGSDFPTLYAPASFRTKSPFPMFRRA